MNTTRPLMATGIEAVGYDAQHIIEAVRLIVGDGAVTELRSLDAVVGGDRYPATYSGYFDSPEALAQAAATIKAAKGIYITPNPVDPALLARAKNRLRKMGRGDNSTGDHDIIARHWLLIDCDAKRPAGISASDDEHDAAIQRCREIYAHLHDRGWPDPIAADSGNGGHLLYRVNLPRDDGGIVERCLAALANRFNDERVHIDTSVFNPARIWKLYGTSARKGDSTEDRPHRMARLLSVPAALELVQ